MREYYETLWEKMSLHGYVIIWCPRYHLDNLVEHRKQTNVQKKKKKLFSICSLSVRKTQYFIRPFHCVCAPGAAHSLGPCDLETG